MECSNNQEMDLFEDIKQNLFVFSQEKMICKERLEQLDNVWNMCDFKVKNHTYINSFCEYDSKRSTSEWFDVYLRMSQTGVGIVFTDSIFDGKYAFNSSNKLMFHTNNGKLINLFKTFTTGVHSNGTKIFLTIKPSIGRGIKQHNKLYSYSASFNKSYYDANYHSKRITDSGLRDIIEVTKNLVLFSKITNFDGVLIDASDFNIIGEMVSQRFNKRCFGYYFGVKTFLNKLIDEVNKISNKYPIILKLTPYTFISCLFKESLDKVKTLNKCVNKKDTFIFNDYLAELVNLGVDGFMFNFGTYETEFLTNQNPLIRENLFLGYFKNVKSYLMDNNVKNKYGDDVYLFYKDNLSFNDELLNEINKGTISSVDVTRDYYADNNYFDKIKTQKPTKKCIKCSICNDFATKYNKLTCAINPITSGYSIRKITSKERKPIAIIGSGYSGLYAAFILAERGFIVDIYEQNNEINIVGRLLNMFGFNKENQILYNYFQLKQGEFAKNNKINIYLNNKFSAENSETKSYKTIIVATGFNERFLNITGAVLKNVKNIYDLLNKQNEILSHKKFILLARSELMVKFAIYLCTQNKSVTLIIPSFSLFENMPNSKMTYYAYLLNELNIKTYINAKVKRINEESADLVINNKLESYDIASIILNLNSKIEYPFLAEVKNIDCDLFVYEPELYSNNRLYYDLVKSGFDGELFMVGSALEIGSLSNDIHSAFFVANNI